MSKNSLKQQAKIVEKTLHNKGFNHLKVSTKSNHLIIYAKDGVEKVNRARLTPGPNNKYQLSMADRRGRWEPTPYKDSPDELLNLLTEDFSFALIDFEELS